MQTVSDTFVMQRQKDKGRLQWIYIVPLL